MLTEAVDAKHPESEPIATAPLAAVEAEGDVEDGPPQTSAGRPREPSKRFPWNTEMREIFELLLENMSEMTRLHQRIT